MKKKIIFFTCCILAMFLLAACSGAEVEEEMYGNMTAADLEERALGLADELTSMGAQDVLQAQLYYSMYGSQEENGEMFSALLDDWTEVVSSCGEFQGYGDFTVDKSGKTVTCKLPINYSQRNAELVFVYNAHSMELTAVNANMIYTIGETMQKAGLNTVMGIGVVFVILVLISILISGFSVINKLEAGMNKKEEVATASPANLEQIRAEEATEDQGELIAVIAAAIAASTGTSTDSFVVRSIRRI
ncbi:MAG: OadG family protein [Lachnospiraceae bacterium]|nr:OadG family protein [Lachnospiraceae bacterium]